MRGGLDALPAVNVNSERHDVNRGLEPESKQRPAVGFGYHDAPVGAPVEMAFKPAALERLFPALNRRKRPCCARPSSGIWRDRASSGTTIVGTRGDVTGAYYASAGAFR